MFPHLHRPVSCVLALLLAAAALIVGAGPASAGEGSTIKRLANAARADVGLDPLTRDSALDELARRWAYKIAADGELSHNPDLAEQVPEGWQRIGENVAMGYPTGAEMHQGWMSSEGHRANILGDYTHIGIAFVAVDGTSWGVQVFAKYPPGVRPTATPEATTPAPTPSRTPAVSVSPSKKPSASPSASESTSALAGYDSETAGPVTSADASNSPSPASSGLFGIGYAEMAVGLLGLSALGLLIGLLMAVWRRRDQRRREMLAERTRFARTNPVKIYPARTYPARTYPARTYPAQTYPGGRHQRER